MPTLTAGLTPAKKRSEIGLEVDLPVRDRDHVGGNIGRDLAFQRFDEGQGGQRASAVRELVNTVPLLVRQSLEPGLDPL
jgi:hypothetical protein